MPSADVVLPARMSRIAVVAPRSRGRDALVELARRGTVELVGNLPPPEGEEAEALRRLSRRGQEDGEGPALLSHRPDVAALEQAGGKRLLEGEVELKRRARLAVDHGSFTAWLGWTPSGGIEDLNDGLATLDAAVVELRRPPGRAADAPRPGGGAEPFRPLVRSYGTARTGTSTPRCSRCVSFVFMFGMMFGDVGHGLMLVLIALAAPRIERGAIRARPPAVAVLLAGGLSAVVFGLLYGEAFGPTGLVPTVWLDPLDEPIKLLVAALASERCCSS